MWRRGGLTNLLLTKTLSLQRNRGCSTSAVGPGVISCEELAAHKTVSFQGTVVVPSSAVGPGQLQKKVAA